ncbi:hypothetical protein MTO96_011672 [Rhipicephalus appendiculatus]
MLGTAFILAGVPEWLASTTMGTSESWGDGVGEVVGLGTGMERAGRPPLRNLSAQADPCFLGPACSSNRTLFGGPWEWPLNLERRLDLDL